MSLLDGTSRKRGAHEVNFKLIFGALGLLQVEILILLSLYGFIFIENGNV